MILGQTRRRTSLVAGTARLLAACAALIAPACVLAEELKVRVTPLTLMAAPQGADAKPTKLPLSNTIQIQSVCYHPEGWIALRMNEYQKQSTIWAGRPDAMHLVATASLTGRKAEEAKREALGNPMINAKGQVVYATGDLFRSTGVWFWEAGSEPTRLGGPEDDKWLRAGGLPLIDDEGNVLTFGETADWDVRVVRVPPGKPPESVFDFGNGKVPGATSMIAKQMYGFDRLDDPEKLTSRMRLNAATGELAFFTVLSLDGRTKANVKISESRMDSRRAEGAWVGVADAKLRLFTLINGNRATRIPAFTGMCNANGDCFGELSWVETVKGPSKGDTPRERTRKGVGYMLPGNKSKEVMGKGDKIPGSTAVFQSLDRADLNATGLFACTVNTDKGIALLSGSKTKTHVVVAPGATLPGTPGPVKAIRSFTICSGGTLLFVVEYVHPEKKKKKKNDELPSGRLWAWREGEEPIMVLSPSGAPLGVGRPASRSEPEEAAGHINIDNAMHGNRMDDDIGQRQLYRVDYPVGADGVDRRLLIVGRSLYVLEAEIVAEKPATKDTTDK
jgi:hypothetical protein